MFDTLTRMGASAAGAYEIKKSLRFDGSSAYLTKTPTAGDRDVWTFSCWYKPANGPEGSTNAFVLFQADSSTVDTYQFSDSKLHMTIQSGSDTGTTSDGVFRDCSSWYHICSSYDGSNLRLYINGVLDKTTSHSGDAKINSNVAHYIGQNGSSARYLPGYLAEFHFVDGTAKAASDFGETDADTGQWIPKKYAGSHGSQGYYLKFDDTSNFGLDSSGNGNNWTASGFGTSGASNDSMEDTPNNNYCTWNRIDKHRDHISVTDGNLVPNQTDSSGFAGVRGTFGVTSGKWYFEFQCGSGSGHMVGWVNSEFNMHDTADVAITTAGTNGHGAVFDSRGFMYGWIGSEAAAWYPDSSNTTTWGNNDVIGCAMDLDNYKFYFAKNNTWINSQDPTDGTNAIIPTGSNNDGDGEYSSGDVMQPYFTGWGNGTGETKFGQNGFSYTPPTGYQALCTANLSEPTIKKGSDHFNTVLYTGNDSDGHAITGVGFQPNLVWIKDRGDSNHHRVYDSVRGVNAALLTSATNAEDQYATYGQFESFDSDGFTVGIGTGNSGQRGEATNSAEPHVAWNWKESATAGFDIVSYTGNGQDNTDVAISHSLGVSPEMLIIKNRDGSNRWQTWHKSLGTHNTYLINNILLNTTGAETFYSSQIRAISSSTFTVRDADADGNANVNKNGDDYIAYLWASVEGYSKSGFYKGNGNADGPFIFTGFKPAMVLIKCSSNAENWNLFDNKRDPDNKVHHLLVPNTSTEENNSTAARELDFLSNGIKIRGTDGTINTDDYTYVYFAFAETPFKYANAR